MSVLGTHLYQRTNWHCHERLRSALVNLFWRLFQFICPFHDGWFTNVSAHTSLGIQQFLTKNGMTPMPHPPIHPISPQVIFFCFPRWKEVLKRKCSCQCGRGETKNSKSTKRNQSWQVQKLFWAVEKCLNRFIASDGEYFEGDEYKHVRINTQFFYE